MGDATVDEDEVGEGPFGVFEAASEDLLEVGEVVVFGMFDFEFAIGGAVGDAVGEDNHRGDGLAAGVMRNIIAFDAARGIGEVK